MPHALEQDGAPDPLGGRRARLVQLDVLRGFALLGILVVNICSFASAYYGLGLGAPPFDGAVDRAVLGLVAWLFETKFYLLFSFLFGYSFHLQEQAAMRAGRSPVPRMLRRHLALCALGLANAVFLFHGDILLTYGLLGLMLLAVRRWWSERQMAVVACVLVLGTVLAWGLLGVLLAWAGMDADLQAALQEAQRAEQAFRGPVASVIAQRVMEWRNTVLLVLTLQAPSAFALMLLGYAAARKGWLARTPPAGRTVRRLAWAALLVGLPGATAYALSSQMVYDSPWVLPGLALALLTSPFLSTGYALVLVRLLRGRAGTGLQAALAPAGRMALSNYLLQSLLCSFIFYGYGLGLMGRLPPLAVLGVAAAIFAAQCAASRWWLSQYAYGPVEWLLRAVTHAAWPRLRRSGT